MKKLHKKIDSDRFPELTERRITKQEREEDMIFSKRKPVQGYVWRKSKYQTRSDGSPIWYLSPVKLRETPEREFKRMKKYK